MTARNLANDTGLRGTNEPMTCVRLYIAGATPSSSRAKKNLLVALGETLKMATPPTVEIIDVFNGPKRAIADGIFVTPTLVVQSRGTRRMMVGDLSDATALGSLLDAGFAQAN